MTLQLELAGEQVIMVITSAVGTNIDLWNGYFALNRLGLSATLRRCLGSMTLIDSSHSGIPQKTRRVTNWKHGDFPLRWWGGSIDREGREPQEEDGIRFGHLFSLLSALGRSERLVSHNGQR